MKSATILTTLATAMGVVAKNVTFSVSDAENNDLGSLVSLHSGAGFNFFFLSEGTSSQVYDLESDNVASLIVPDSQYPYNVGTLAQFFAVGPLITPLTLDLDDGVIENYNFWGCYNVNDPYNYSATRRAVLYNEKGNSTAPASDCIPLTLSLKNE